MEKMTAEQIHEAVRANYGARARDIAEGADTESCGDTAPAGARQRFYGGEQIEDMPDSVVSYGCGNPLAIADLQRGEVVLDLGSGAGLDCFLAAQRVGTDGSVIGVDMTDEMIALAERNKSKLGVKNVEFRKGLMEALPVEEASVDVIISNCVINLAPDKDAVFAEAHRVLRPGGRLQVSDIVLLRELSEAEQEDANLWSSCKAGALVVGDYVSRLEAAGFGNVSIAVGAAPAGDLTPNPWRSGLISAYKGGAESTPKRRRLDERIELLAPAGLEARSCCGDDCCTSE